MRTLLTILIAAVPVCVAGEDSVRLYEHVAPKALGTVPEGWRLEKLQGHSIQQPPISLPNGDSTNISTTAYALTPIPAPGVVVMRDPGFAPAEGLAQTGTLGAMLTAQIENAGKLEQKLGVAIQQLREQLGTQTAQATQPAPAPQESKPKPEAEAKPDPKPAPKPRAKPTPTPAPAATPAPTPVPEKGWGIFRKK